MNYAFGIIAVIIISIVMIGIYLFIQYPYMIKAIRYTILKGQWTTGLKDYQFFETRKISTENPEPWLSSHLLGEVSMPAETLAIAQKLKTTAFLVAKEGEIIFELYDRGYKKSTLSNSFSMAKSIVTLLLGAAIDDGYISSLDENVSQYFPQYQQGLGANLTVGDLARMSSGMDWTEYYYSPINVTTEAYYGNQLSQLILNRKIISPPGQSFNYLSGNTQLLAMVLDQVLPMSLSEYLSVKFWKPMGMEYDARWMIDPVSNIERSYCCINATARDFLKMGQLFLQKGQWKDQTLISRSMVEKMTYPFFEESPQYGYGLWLDLSYTYPFYMMRGHLGQYTIVIPSENIVITRLGHRKSKHKVEEKDMTLDIYQYIDGVMDMVNKS